MNPALTEESFYAGQTHILELVAASAPLSEILTKLIHLMEAQVEGILCSILLLDSNGLRVSHGAAPSLPAEYVRAINGAPIGPRHGSCGTAMFRRQQVVVTDILTDPLWEDYRPLVEGFGLRACWSTPILSPQGNVLGSFAIYRREPRGPTAQEIKLTEVATHIAGIAIQHQRVQEALREREERISVAAESADLALWVVYPERNEVWMSEKGRSIYGFRNDEKLTRDLLIKRAHPDDAAGVKKVFDHACHFPGPFESEHRLLLPAGKTRWVIMRGKCLQDELGNLSEIIGVSIDVSAQKKSELQLQIQREEMAHLNRVALMGEMTASVAHELNQPLTAISNNAAAARRFFEHGNLDPDLLRQLLQDMASDSQRAAEVIRGIRALVRKDKSPRAPLNLNAIIADTLRLVGSDAVLRECVITTEMDHNLPQVEATAVQMQQVLLNLIMNALDAIELMPASSRRITIITRGLADTAKVSVRDYGVGLPKDRPGKVFDHFYSTKDSGMGMGLTIVRSIIETHGGTISAENAEGGGACFSFRLPAAQKTQQSAAA